MNMVVEKFQLLLTNAYMLNNRMRHLEFDVLLKDNQILTYLPGQFIGLIIEKNNNIVRRNFSIANPPSNTRKIEIAATFVPNGIASTTLWELKIGDTLNASGPFGIFVLNPIELRKSTRYILIATGTGVTPYRAMLPYIKSILSNHESSKMQFVLLLGVRNNQELLYAKEFLAFENINPNFRFIACYSRENNSNFDPFSVRPREEYFGYVQNKLVELGINPQSDTIYLCGNPNMVDETMLVLERHNVPRNRIKREKYISSK